jgi:hypothetical protein
MPPKPHTRDCPGPVSRRSVLQAGALGMLGLGWPQLLAAREKSAGRAPRLPGFGKAKRCLFIYLDGGMSHIDSLDMKPESPVECRGEFKPVATNEPGIEICEHLPQMARVMDRVSLVRSMGQRGRAVIGDAHHTGAYYYLTGREPDVTFGVQRLNRKPQSDDWPYIGSVAASKLERQLKMPPQVALPAKAHSAQYIRAGQFGAKLGVMYDPLFLLGNDEKPGEFTLPALELPADVTLSRLDNRSQLLADLDDVSRGVDRTSRVVTLDRHRQKALSLLHAAGAKGAFDLTGEPQSVRERYGPDVNCQSFLMARRLIESGVPFVSVFWKKGDRNKLGGCFSWDTHRDNFNCLKSYLLPLLDTCYSALIEDLDQRGLLEETLVVLVSEMGRTPKVGDPRPGGENGRDHWTHCQTVVLAGGGVKRGFVMGASDRVAGYPVDAAVGPEDLAATVYHALGIDDLRAATPEGREFDLVDIGRPMTPLFA